MVIEIISKETGKVIARDTNSVTAKHLAELMNGVCVTKTINN